MAVFKTTPHEPAEPIVPRRLYMLITSLYRVNRIGVLCRHPWPGVVFRTTVTECMYDGVIMIDVTVYTSLHPTVCKYVATLHHISTQREM